MKTVPMGKFGATAPASQRRRAAACSARKTLSRCKASTRYQLLAPDRNGGPERAAHMRGQCRRENFASAVFLPGLCGGLAIDGAGPNATRSGRPLQGSLVA